ncbi:MAG: hypothetical protein ACOH1K_03980, partial [Rhodoglobus sp.]
MADEPNWEDIFGDQSESQDPKPPAEAQPKDSAAAGETQNLPTGDQTSSDQTSSDQPPMTRREAREAEAARAKSAVSAPPASAAV